MGRVVGGVRICANCVARERGGGLRVGGRCGYWPVKLATIHILNPSSLQDSETTRQDKTRSPSPMSPTEHVDHAGQSGSGDSRLCRLKTSPILGILGKGAPPTSKQTYLVSDIRQIPNNRNQPNHKIQCNIKQHPYQYGIR